MTAKLTQEEFINKAIATHGTKYSYEKAIYRTSQVHVVVTCKAHGDFSIMPSNLLAGKECRKCSAGRAGVSKRSNQATYIDKVTRIHQNTYDYSETLYTRLADHITVTCTRHGPFVIKANNHASGRGCAACAKSGFKLDKPAYLYILQCEDITKIGITNRKPKSRASKISRSYGKSFNVIHEYKFDLGKEALDLETTLLKELKVEYKQPTTVFDGSTECFYDVDIDKLKERISSDIN